VCICVYINYIWICVYMCIYKLSEGLKVLLHLTSMCESKMSTKYIYIYIYVWTCVRMYVHYRGGRGQCLSTTHWCSLIRPLQEISSWRCDLILPMWFVCPLNLVEGCVFSQLNSSMCVWIHACIVNKCVWMCVYLYIIIYKCVCVCVCILSGGLKQMSSDKSTCTYITCGKTQNV